MPKWVCGHCGADYRPLVALGPLPPVEDDVRAEEMGRHANADCLIDGDYGTLSADAWRLLLKYS